MNPVTRRHFLGAAAVSAAALSQTKSFGAATLAAPRRVKLGLIGSGWWGMVVVKAGFAAGGVEIVAICDVDTDRLAKKKEKYPKAKEFTDFREMFDKMGKEFDAVTISTPDHTHAVATMMAMKAGKHVYTQKPLTHDVWEARQLLEAAGSTRSRPRWGTRGRRTTSSARASRRSGPGCSGM